MDTVAAGREIAHDAMKDYGDRDPRDVLSQWERDNGLGNARPQLRFPIRDPVELKQHLVLTIGVLTELVAALDRIGQKDKSALFFARSRIQWLNKKLNGKRHIPSP